MQEHENRRAVEELQSTRDILDSVGEDGALAAVIHDATRPYGDDVQHRSFGLPGQEQRHLSRAAAAVAADAVSRSPPPSRRGRAVARCRRARARWRTQAVAGVGRRRARRRTAAARYGTWRHECAPLAHGRAQIDVLRTRTPSLTHTHTLSHVRARARTLCDGMRVFVCVCVCCAFVRACRRTHVAALPRHVCMYRRRILPTRATRISCATRGALSFVGHTAAAAAAAFPSDAHFDWARTARRAHVSCIDLRQRRNIRASRTREHAYHKFTYVARTVPPLVAPVCAGTMRIAAQMQRCASECTGETGGKIGCTSRRRYHEWMCTALV
eukprot:IDg16465t1